MTNHRLHPPAVAGEELSMIIPAGAPVPPGWNKFGPVVIKDRDTREGQQGILCWRISDGTEDEFPYPVRRLPGLATCDDLIEASIAAPRLDLDYLSVRLLSPPDDGREVARFDRGWDEVAALIWAKAQANAKRAQFAVVEVVDGRERSTVRFKP